MSTQLIESLKRLLHDKKLITVEQINNMTTLTDEEKARIITNQ